MTYKTTKADFLKFKQSAKYWLSFFSMGTWEVFFEHGDLDARANCQWDESGRIATMTLGKTWNHKPEYNELEKCGFHEVCELLLGRLTILAWRDSSNSRVEERIHEIIRRLESSVFVVFKLRAIRASRKAAQKERSK